TARALGLLSGGVFLHLMAVMTYGLEIELTGSQSGFPARMFTLPVSTRMLVAWPMALGALAMAGAWLVVDLAVLRPCGVAAPLAIPAAIVAASLMAIQSLAWAPFEFGWGRPLVLAALAAALVTATVVARNMDAPNELLLGGYLVLLPAFYAAAVAGVARARRGDAYSWRWLEDVVRIASRLAPHRREPFASAAGAQLWFECRRHAAQLPAFTCLILVEMGIALALMAVNEGDRTLVARLGRVGIVALPVIMAAVLAAVVGPGVGKHDLLARRYETSSFFAARPMTDRDVVAAKFKMAAVSSLLAWALALSLPAIWLMAPGNYARLADLLSELTQGMPGWKLALAAAAAIVVPPIFIWKQMVQGMYVGLTGHAWVVRAYGYVYGALLPAVLVFGGLALFWMPEYRPFAWRMAPWLVAAALAAKAVLAPLAWRALVHRRIVPSGTLQKWLALWCAAVIALTGLILGIAPAGAISFGAALAAAIFLVPFNRLAVAPLAWNWNRHR
ncbi:MAG TPA: hypothetical protein VHC19_14090, partial [Pirellulales bacterium]|nr:hypothetical protein [Pirellulales bacterium]